MKYKQLAQVFAILIIFIFIKGCATNPDYATQFRFPITEGSIDEGEEAFVDLGCNQCHTVNGVDLPVYDGESPLTFELGGDIIFVKTYADLVTSIINPDHVISPKYKRMLGNDEMKNSASPMPSNDQMTVAQLIDLVMFLNSRYILMKRYEPYRDLVL
jgi:hypothetical protein